MRKLVVTSRKVFCLFFKRDMWWARGSPFSDSLNVVMSVCDPWKSDTHFVTLRRQGWGQRSICFSLKCWCSKDRRNLDFWCCQWATELPTLKPPSGPPVTKDDKCPYFVSSFLFGFLLLAARKHPNWYTNKPIRRQPMDDLIINPTLMALTICQAWF